MRQTNLKCVFGAGKRSLLLLPERVRLDNVHMINLIIVNLLQNKDKIFVLFINEKNIKKDIRTCKFCKIFKMGLTASYLRPLMSITNTKLFLLLLEKRKET